MTEKQMNTLRGIIMELVKTLRDLCGILSRPGIVQTAEQSKGGGNSSGSLRAVSRETNMEKVNRTSDSFDLRKRQAAYDKRNPHIKNKEGIYI